MGTFNERLHDAMLASGIETASELARRCGVSRHTAAHWLTCMEPDLSTAHLLVVCDLLRVRVKWLAAGRGKPTPYSPQATEALEILDRLSAAKVAIWFRWGMRLIECRKRGLVR